MSNKEKLEQLYNLIDEYLYLPDKNIIKLLCAFAVSCYLPQQPPWLFIVSGPSTAKSDLVTLLKGLEGYFPIDDLTNNALLSGMKRHDTSSSLLHRAPKDGGFLMFSDFTTMISKRKEDLAVIMSQLRVVFDGKSTKHTGGQEETISWEGKLGLLAACTSILYHKTAEFAEMGQRMIIYHLPKVDNRAVGRFKFKHAKDDRAALKKKIQTMISDIVSSTVVPKSMSELNDFDAQTETDLIDIAHLAASARSPINRNKYTQDQRPESNEDPEGIGRILGQLMITAQALMVFNQDGKLYPEDREIIYQIGLDCIDPGKRKILEALTEYSYGGDIDSIYSTTYGLHKDVVTRTVEDLCSLGLVTESRQHYGSGTKRVYTLKDEFKDIMSRFKHIEIRNEELLGDQNDPFNIGVV